MAFRSSVRRCVGADFCLLSREQSVCCGSSPPVAQNVPRYDNAVHMYTALCRHSKMLVGLRPRTAYFLCPFFLYRACIFFASQQRLGGASLRSRYFLCFCWLLLFISKQCVGGASLRVLVAAVVSSPKQLVTGRPSGGLRGSLVHLLAGSKVAGSILSLRAINS